MTLDTFSGAKRARNIAQELTNPEPSEAGTDPTPQGLLSMTPRVEEWEVEYYDEKGTKHREVVTSTVLSVDGEILVGAVASRIARAPITNLSTHAQALVTMLARVTQQVEMSDRLDKVVSLDSDTLAAIHEKCMEHANRFFRRRPVEGEDIPFGVVSITRASGNAQA